MSERHTFDLASHAVPEAGKKERFRRNRAAINVLKECEFDNRFATPEEQEILSQYVGWGGIPEEMCIRDRSYPATMAASPLRMCLTEAGISVRSSSRQMCIRDRSHDQAIRMRKFFEEGKLTTEAISAIMSEEKQIGRAHV